MNFVTFLSDMQSIHLKKDVGSIPYILNHEKNINASLLTYNLRNDVVIEAKNQYGLDLRGINNKYGFIIDNFLYFKKNAKLIDILNLYHIDKMSFYQTIFYKLFNRKGKVYIKMDCDINDFNRVYLNKYKRFLMLNTLYILSHVISVESSKVLKYVHNCGYSKITLITNGINVNVNQSSENYKKENIILTVGRIGSYQKATDILLEAAIPFLQKNPNWQVHIIGEIEENFYSVIDDFQKNNIDIKDRIVFLGEIRDQTKLMKEYSKSKVFVLPSRYESFGLVLLEALFKGCYIIMSDSIPPATDLLINDKYGVTFKNENSMDLFNKLTIGSDDKLYENKYIKAREELIIKKFNWSIICESILKIIK
jgi:glycosyltransferase involved in cell wall biosynthesis